MQNPARSNSNPNAPSSSAQQIIDIPVTPSISSDAKVPGFDLIDGFANVLFCPGRAIMLQTAPQGQGLTGKDLPVVILISAAVWYGMYWLATSQSSPLQGMLSADSAKKKKRVFRVPRKGKVISSSEEELDDEDDLEDEEEED